MALINRFSLTPEEVATHCRASAEPRPSPETGRTGPPLRSLIGLQSDVNGRGGKEAPAW